MEKVETDWFWFGGFFDGEGSISLSMKGVCYTQGCVSITNNELQLIKVCMKIATSVIPTTVIRHRSGQGCFVLIWSNYNGSRLLQKLLPFLRNPRQRQRAELYLEFFDATKYRQLGQRPKREAIMVQWKRLPHKGPKVK